MSGTDFLTSVARFFVKTCFHKKCGVFAACKKVKDFFDTLRPSASRMAELLFENYAVLNCRQITLIPFQKVIPPAKRLNMTATCERTALPFGLSVVLLVPLMIPAPIAQHMLSRAKELTCCASE